MNSDCPQAPRISDMTANLLFQVLNYEERIKSETARSLFAGDREIQQDSSIVPKSK